MKRKSAKDENSEDASISAMRLRAYPNAGQLSRAGHWLYIAHAFRNRAVEFVETRRRDRAAWIHNHPLLYAETGMIEDFAGSDADACSRWLTDTLDASRKAARLEFGLIDNKRTLPQQLASAWKALSREERDWISEFYEAEGIYLTWCILPRTVLDQVVRDLGKTISKAISDRKDNKTRKSRGQKPLKAAGFPKFRKWTYANSIRFQVNASKNQDVREAWERKELFIPGIGRIKVRENGYTWPSKPPSLITLARSAGDTWHVSFVCKEGDGQSSRSRRLEKSSRTWDRLPVDIEGRPTIEGLDMSLMDKAVSNRHGKLGRTRYLKRCRENLRFRNKQVSRRKKGSGRWKKSARKLGKLHNTVAEQRLHENRSAAATVADRSAIVCVETLRTAFMFKNRRLAQSIADLGWGQFLHELERAMAARGHLLLYAGQFCPTTQTCPVCKTINRTLKNNLTIRKWDCPNCYTHHDRDVAAADNIQEDAIKIFLDSISNGAESVPGMRKLHPELASFISRGGMAAILCESKRVSRQVNIIRLDDACAMRVPVKRGSLHSNDLRQERSRVGEA